MYNIEREYFLKVVELMPKYGIQYRDFAHDNPYIITAETFFNYIRGKSTPTEKKIFLVLQTLKTSYKSIYEKIEAQLLSEYGANSTKELVLNKIKEDLEIII